MNRTEPRPHPVPFAPGSVWLVGAGPGDPGLLTLHAVDALRRADVVVYDALVSPGVLDFVPPETEREFAGKRGGRPSPSQQDITLRLIALARAGRRVVRLKGGDPFVFARGGEEAAALARENIPFRVIPGITAGLAALAYAGIPATARETNQAIVLAAGHEAAGAGRMLDWTALGGADLPVVVYMGLSRLAEIADEMIAGGRPPETPVAIVSEATTPGQACHVTTLSAAAAEVARLGLKSPAIIAIGSIVRLRALLAPWQLGAGRAP